jgi:hypothetical protein
MVIQRTFIGPTAPGLKPEQEASGAGAADQLPVGSHWSQRLTRSRPLPFET